MVGNKQSIFLSLPDIIKFSYVAHGRIYISAVARNETQSGSDRGLPRPGLNFDITPFQCKFRLTAPVKEPTDLSGFW